MKLSKRTNRGGNLQLNMTPMIDCVFLLLIFFMTCTQVSAVNKTQLELSRLKGARDQTEATITINVLRDGEIQVTGQPVEIPQLADLLAAAVHDHGKGNVNVILRIHRGADFRSFNQIIDLLKRLDISRMGTRVESD